MAEVKKVVFANDEVTIHMLLDEKQQADGTYSTESQVLLPGQFVPLEKVPPYLLDAVKDGTAPRLELMAERRAKEISKKAEQIRNLGKETINVQGPASEGDEMSESVRAAEASLPEENS